MTSETTARLVRQATVGDAERLAEFAARVFWQAYEGQMRAADLRAYMTEHYGVAQQTRELSDPAAATFLAETDGAIIGFVQVRQNSQPVSPMDGPAAELQRIYVDGAVRSSGVGARLFATCLDYARSRHAHWLWLSVWQQNPRAIAFYQRQGMRITGQQSFRVGSDVQQDYVMAIRIQRGA
jgi:diamine N-acetyltransferase